MNAQHHPYPQAHAHSLPARRELAEGMIARGEPLEETLALLCHIVEAEASHPVRAAILLVDHATGRLHTGAAPGLPDRYNRAVDGLAVSAGVGTCARAAALNEIVETEDIATDPRWKGIAHLPLGLGLVAAWSMPITAADGRVLGTLGTYFTERRAPTEHERQLVAQLARIAADAIEKSTTVA